MIKKLLPLLLVPSLAMAHGHQPQKHKEYLVRPYLDFEFTVTNGFAKKTCFDIAVNDEIYVPLRTCLGSKQDKTMRVRIKSPADVVTKSTVCSLADNKAGMRTRMCSEITTLFPATKLGLNK